MSISKTLVQRLFIKRKRGTSMSETQCLGLSRGYGIEGDVNADAISPRQVLIVSSEDLSQLSIPPGALRENIVLDHVSSETFRPGALITFPSGAAIRLTFYCEPCKRIAHLVGSLKDVQEKRGILGVVVRTGEIEIDDMAELEANYFPALSEKPYERFLEFSLKIPRGKVVTYKQVIKGIGVDNSYFRAIPLYIKKTPRSYPIHRILDSKGKTISHIPQQKKLLEAEGIEFVSNLDPFDNNHSSVLLQKYVWKDSSIYLGQDFK